MFGVNLAYADRHAQNSTLSEITGWYLVIYLPLVVLSLGAVGWCIYSTLAEHRSYPIVLTHSSLVLALGYPMSPLFIFKLAMFGVSYQAGGF